MAGTSGSARTRFTSPSHEYNPQNKPQAYTQSWYRETCCVCKIWEVPQRYFETGFLNFQVSVYVFTKTRIGSLYVPSSVQVVTH